MLMLKIIVVSLTLCLLATAAEAQSRKFRVNDPAAASRLLAQGGKLIADYGAFQIIEASATSAAGESNRVESAEEDNFIELHAARLDTRTPAARSLRKAVAPKSGRQLHLVQFVGPIKPAWRADLEQTGMRVVTYIPQNAYLVYGGAGALTQLQAWAATNSFVQWEGVYADEFKINPAARTTNAFGQARWPGTTTFAIQLVDDASANSNTLAQVDALKLSPVERESRVLGYLNLFVELPPERLAELATNADVVSIQPYFPRKKFCERQAQIMAGNLSGNVPSGPGYLAWLAGKGFTQAQFDASGFVVDVSDSGVDNGTTSPNHFGLHVGGTNALPGRVAYARLEGTPNNGSTLQGCDGHGNLNAHIIGGYDNLSGSPFADASGYHYGLGICPFVKVASSVIFDPDTFTSPNYNNLMSRAYRDGARVSNNSWGADTAGAYDSDAQNYDALVRDAQPAVSSVPAAGNQQMVIVFAAGNAGSGAGTVGSPGTGKNIICVGAGENVQAFGGSDGSGVSDTGADSANDVISFSSRGPCDDGRFKPDLCAPGTHVSGGVAQAANPSATGTAIACYDGTGVSGGVNSIYFPSAGQQFYTASSGTSHSTPGIAGACALLRQYFINQSLTPPSPAMTKAYLVNSTRYMTGTGAGGTLPSNSQGMGEVNLSTAFDGVSRVLHDQLPADKFTASGQARTLNGVVANSAKPFRVTLAWTDAPGSTTGNAYNNDLDLTVTVGGNTYKGNVFSGSNSITGGTADAKDNLESVLIPAGVSGPFTVTVTAANINSDGVPNEAPALDQDYALVIYNASETPVPSIQGAGYSITNESCVTANGVVDPGETVTVNFALQNLGTASTSNLVATLLATGGVASPSGAQVYGAVITNGAPVTQPFTFTANGTCGGSVTATLALQDGTNDLGTITFTLPLGLTAVFSSENFDAVTAPALPVGWSTTAGGGQSVWVTTTTQRDSQPNAAFSPDAATKGSNELVSAAFTLPANASQLSFRHRYELEPGYDGGVLEIKIGAGAYTDIVAAGGTFVSGGYTTTLSTGNALGARQAWSGTNATFTPVIVNLPAGAAGQSVRFRWRCGSDASVSRAGWWVDSVAVTGAICCGDVVAPVILAQPQSTNAISGAAVNFSVNAVGSAPLGYQWYFNSNAISGATATNYSIANAAVTNAGNYFVVITNAASSVTSSVAVLAIVIPSPYSGILAAWEMTGLSNYGPTPFAATSNAPNVNVFGLTRGSGVGTVGTAGTDAWGGTGFVFTDAATAIAGNSFATFGLTVASGYVISFTNIPAYNIRHSSTGSKTGLWQYQVGNGAFVDIGSAITWGGNNSSSGNAQSAINLSGISALQNIPAGTLVTFRIVLWDGTGTGSWYINNLASGYDFQVLGTLSPVSVAPAAPVITVPPATTNVFAGKNAGFSVTATGDAPLNFQWLKNGNPFADAGAIAGARTNVLAFTPAATNHAGSYSVIVTNLGGSVTSSVALLNVAPLPTLVFSNSAGGLELGADNGAVSNAYIIQSATNLLPPILWTPLLTNVIGTNGQIRFTETNYHLPASFYRIVIP